jgi:squalene-hopene/tetraprenyl-beta-curcumene cyclase
LTAHALRAINIANRLWFKHSHSEVERSVKYLAMQQRADGSWLPLWFGNQYAPDDINPVYGTARVLAAYRDLGFGLVDSPECQRGIVFLLSVQNPDGGWGGAKDCPSSVEETALVVEVLVELVRDWQPQSLRSQSTEGLIRIPPTLPDADEDRVEGARSRQIQRGLLWLIDAVESGRFRDPSPIGFYFAKLWYFEKLYPLIFTVAALGRATRQAATPAER